MVLGLRNRPFAPDIHTINLSLINKPGVLSRVLVMLQHINANIETVSVYPHDDGATSTAILAVNVPRSRLDLIALKLQRLVDVLQVDVVGSPVEVT